MNTIVVAGLGRCGSSLVMQMLHAGGVACVGSYPDFEEHEPERSRLWDSKAVKVLDPHRNKLPDNCKVIWLDRAPTEQAKSQVKFLQAFTRERMHPKYAIRLCSKLRWDRQKALIAIGAKPLLVIRFENLLSDPVQEVHRIVEFTGAKIDRYEAVRQVVPRSPECAPDLAMEISLVRRAQEREATA